MKRSLVAILAFSVIVVVFSNCHGSKKSAGATVMTKPGVSYSTDMKSLVLAYCSPCHIPEKGGNKKALDNYDALKGDIEDVIHRIDLNPTDRGFMPFKKAKLSDSTIAVFKQWRDAGMPQ
jgi:cytochrome c553